MEFDILNRFKHRSIPFQQRPLNTDWEYLFFMQHFGVPTRLLDWSENSHVALYFAIAAAEEHRDSSGAFRIQQTLESLYKSVNGEYHYADTAWAYVKRRTDVDLLGILKELAAERTAQHGQ